MLEKLRKSVLVYKKMIFGTSESDTKEIIAHLASEAGSFEGPFEKPLVNPV